MREMIQGTVVVLLGGMLLSAAEPKPPEQKPLPPIQKVQKVKPKPSVFRRKNSKQPLVVKSAEDAVKHFDEKSLALLKEKVDFEKQFVLIFAWRGSGGDKLTYAVLESYPEQIHFKY